MAFNNIPPNGFPALPDVEDLEAVVKDVTALKLSVSGLSEDVSDLNDNKANQITIAPFFNSETSYDVGDLVYYNGLTYRCTNAHEGEWDADDFSGTTIANELDELKSGLIVNKSQSTNVVDVNGTFQIGANVLKHNTIIVGMHRYAYGSSVVLQKDVLEAGLYNNGCGIYVNTSTYVTFTVSDTGLITVKAISSEWGPVNIIVYGIL